tara:strand:+ start:434 stop:1771 length:1338 start_codon:yes stop_codon:yes gene_type:complete
MANNNSYEPQTLGEKRAFVNVRLVDPESGLDVLGSLLIFDGKIMDLGPRLFADGLPSDITTIDGGGHCLCPGLIDMRAFVGEPGAEHKETLSTASAAAAIGGITTLIATPDTDPTIDDVALVELLERSAQDTARVNVHPMAAITKGLRGVEMTEMGLLASAGAVAFTDGNVTISDALVMRRALAYASTFDLLIDHLPQENSLSAEGCTNEGEVATRLGLTGIPSVAESIVLDRDLRLTELTGSRLHASHLTTEMSISAVRNAKARDVRVTCSVTPHHFTLNETAIGEYRTFAKTWPPLRSESDRCALIDGLSDGTVDVISSGHTPQDQESKRLPFAQAATGISGLETMLPLALDLYHKGKLSLHTLLQKMTSTPARLLNLKSGRLISGAPADLILIDIDSPWLIDPDQFLSKSKNSPFEKHPVQGRVLQTLVAGQPVYDRTLQPT